MSKLRCGYFLALVVVSATLSACKITGEGKAPIIDAGTAVGHIPAGGTAVDTPPSPRAGEAVYYTVQPGDSLRKIGTQFGQDWRNIAAWNNMSDPNVLEVGQVLLVVPAGGAQGPVATPPASGTATSQPVGSGQIEARPSGVENRMQWVWPAKGQVVGQFGGNNKGIDIAGQSGDPVYAAADGRVAYVGDGLRGYGNLVIIKHNDVFVTAYAHNQKILVQENQVVRKGEQIAEMGNTDASRVMLHFEVRQQSAEGGTAVDPMRYLPAR